jgi:chromosome segregation ATPase
MAIMVDDEGQLEAVWITSPQEGTAYCAAEIDELRQQVEELEIDNESIRSKLHNYRAKFSWAQGKYDSLKADFEEKVSEANDSLRSKTMIYLSLINEYEKIIDQYATSTGIKLITNTIDNLRKRGELIT